MQRKWLALTLLANTLTLIGMSCTSVRDALVNGAYDFISGSATDLLSQLLTQATT
jgi:hypothetical protein